jgi:LAGLIDADG endonuclease
VDKDFGNWLAGFIDGEGCFHIAAVNRPGGFRPRFTLTVRADDATIVQEAAAVTGVGRTHFYRAASGNRVIRWCVQAQADCEALCVLLRQHPLRAKKKHDFDVWEEAVVVAAGLRSGRANNDETYAQLARLKAQLTLIREEGLRAAA